MDTKMEKEHRAYLFECGLINLEDKVITEQEEVRKMDAERDERLRYELQLERKSYPNTGGAG